MKQNQNQDISFYFQLLSKIIDMDAYPFIQLILKKNLEQSEYEELLSLVARLDKRYQKEKEEGLIDFSSLLIEFAGLLNEKLDPNETIYAMRKENYYTALFDEFIQILEMEEAKGKRTR